MNVVLADVEGDALREATKAIEQRGARAIGVQTDVAQPDSLRELARRTVEEFGEAHLLCNNAGVFASGGALWETPLSDFEWQFGVNIMGIVHGVQAFVPIMLEQGGEAHVVQLALRNDGQGERGVEASQTTKPLRRRRAQYRGGHQVTGEQTFLE